MITINPIYNLEEIKPTTAGAFLTQERQRRVYDYTMWLRTRRGLSKDEIEVAFENINFILSILS